MNQKRSSLKPLQGANSTLRRRLDLKGEVVLAIAPTGIVLLVSTSLSFALKAGNINNLVLFAWALAITTILVGLEHYALWLLAYYRHN
ncbi:hypothetical protein [Anabaena sp. UHCC 0451]|uniref:hypothetical protein n=1 Tax=Anabaena sp. UHCC 0451 TaxID=2055235 RepID=UPI002B213135|nr:hypothetical protein [Anabaena sp. UHCC 0451]MEA5578747.1 hypothetical protein [Anabaena sp. UHCC 0451]